MENFKRITIFAVIVIMVIVGIRMIPKPQAKEPPSPSPSVFEPSNSDKTFGDTIKEDAERLEKLYVNTTSKNPVPLVGLYTKDFSCLENFGDAINTLGWFDFPWSPSVNKISQCLDRHEYIAFITLQPKDMDLNDIIDGVYDDVFISYFKELSKGDRVNTDVYVRFAHEMERQPEWKAWYTWQGYEFQTYISMWKHVVDLGREYAPNIKWVWSPNRQSELSQNYYPGDDYVDYISLTLNNTFGYTAFSQCYAEKGSRNIAELYNKPLIFGEAGTTGTPEEKAAYLQSTFNFLNNYKIKCVGIIFFDFSFNGGHQYQFSNLPECVETFNSNSLNYQK